MNKLKKIATEAALKKVKDEILIYANKDKLAGQVITRTNADPEFRHFIALIVQAIGLMEILEEDKKK